MSGKNAFSGFLPGRFPVPFCSCQPATMYSISDLQMYLPSERNTLRGHKPEHRGSTTSGSYLYHIDADSLIAARSTNWQRRQCPETEDTFPGRSRALQIASELS
jgi:hypothetical protein